MNDRRRRNNSQQQQEQTPLFSYRSESVIVGHALLDAAFFWNTNAKIQPHFFSSPRLGRIWQALIKATEAGKQPTATWVPLYIRNESPEDDPLPFYLNLLKNDASEEAEFDLHVDTVIQLANKRLLIEALDQAKHEILTADAAKSPEEMQDIAMRTVGRAISGEGDRFIRTYDEWGEMVAADVGASLDRGEDSGGIGLSCGLAGVEDVIGRLLPENLYVLAGMSGAGKSALAAQILEAAMVDAAARNLGWGYVASLEMSGKDYATRALSRSMGIKSSDIQIGNVARSQYDAMFGHARSLRRFNIEIDSTPRMDMDTIRAHMLSCKNRHGGLAIAVIDHLIIVAAMKGQTLFDKVTHASMAGKELAKEFGIPVIMLAQLTEKKILETGSKWPNGSHLFGGETIYQNADVVSFIHRHHLILQKSEPAKSSEKLHDKWVQDMDTYPESRADFFSDKRRGGAPRRSRQLRFTGETVSFEDI